MDTLDNFERWKEFLGSQVDKAQAMGISNERITEVAAKLGDYLAKKVDPRNEQERLLKQLWDSANDDEQRTLASLMVKMTDKAH
ncbi:hypothetical protein GCM10025857_29080 [Alicyclobacillus contaminans]|uniref:DUF3243 domain-containing protein n=1 Tax=Alicyclobacillus contaminans TaxID=392016 RepID=UPI00040F7403|nr:DUF3243 domain-containing protein [Alicyclobacillus contaminans]GMA51551.1 hypothetical protein GCM10025857_29080 [Alicyclobacillus contaminans]